MSQWQIDLLERVAGKAEGVALGEGAFAPGPALWVGKREIAHFDAERTLDLRLTKAVIRDRRAELKADSRVELRPGASDWIELDLASPADEAWAIALVADAVDANRPTAPKGAPPTGADLARRRRFH